MYWQSTVNIITQVITCQTSVSALYEVMLVNLWIHLEIYLLCKLKHKLDVNLCLMNKT